jgi:hypothetical protein
MVVVMLVYVFDAIVLDDHTMEPFLIEIRLVVPGTKESVQLSADDRDCSFSLFRLREDAEVRNHDVDLDVSQRHRDLEHMHQEHYQSDQYLPDSDVGHSAVVLECTFPRQFDFVSVRIVVGLIVTNSDDDH